MSEVQPARTGGSRGRGGFRGGRGGYRGGRNPSRTKKEDNEQENIPPVNLEDQGEVGELKRKFGDKVPLLREVCPGWSDEDLVFALQETDGDVEAAVDRISSGTISQWGEVKKKQPKPKEPTPSAETIASRGRGRGAYEARGRGRTTERGGRGGRGARAVSQANGTKHTSKTADDGWANATETAPPNGDAAVQGDWDKDPTQEAAGTSTATETKPAASSSLPAKKAGGWAGLFAKPDPPPKQPAALTSAPVAHPEEPPPPTSSVPVAEELAATQPLPPPPIEPQLVDDYPSELPSAPHSDTAAPLTPSKDELTETNLEQLPDESHPPASQTAASTVATTVDPSSQLDVSRPLRPISGYAATALKATGGGGRSASFQRKMKEQQEAVVMPGNHAVEKTAVQFGKMGLNDDGDVDVDEDREEPETRTQLPDDSPTAPRTSLPPVVSDTQPRVPAAAPAAPEPQQTQRQAPGLPPAPQQAPQTSVQNPPGYGDPYRYGHGHKAYDPFGQPTNQSQLPQTTQEPFSNQVPGQSQPSSVQTDYSNYYGRDAYQQYYSSYGQGQDAQRTGSTFATSSQEAPSQYATARPHQGFGQQDAQNSGQNTPAPGMPSHQQQQHSHMGSHGGHAGYPYGYAGAYNQQYPQYGSNYMNQMSHRYGANRPMFDDVRRQEEYYGNQYAYGHNQGYGNSYKSNMYGQPQQQFSYDHSSSPANVGAFGAREGMYGRSGSAQPTEGQQTAGGHGFGGMQDPFGRTSSGFGQNQSVSQQHSGHQGEDPAKATGPSPSVQAGRPGSTVNSSQGQQGSFPPQSQHSGQQAFGAYPQYGAGFGNFGQQGHQTSAYGGYGSNAFGSYGGYGGGRGWNH